MSDQIAKPNRQSPENLFNRAKIPGEKCFRNLSIVMERITHQTSEPTNRPITNKELVAMLMPCVSLQAENMAINDAIVSGLANVSASVEANNEP